MSLCGRSVREKQRSSQWKRKRGGRGPALGKYVDFICLLHSHGVLKGGISRGEEEGGKKGSHVAGGNNHLSGKSEGKGTRGK